ncbi:YppG family protein [Cytobacillus sp. IB215665]|uniref:YppG family protein n=1 Tax=Cytobacillus sp. IB215665 TaxID=3097357 RepID=UPI002A170FDA|nr:YppG family protein [Cytobacillus sp. IB215665]MDX8366486.1 YppG family protein [Cytobacillus sp. IB215665]
MMMHQRNNRYPFPPVWRPPFPRPPFSQGPFVPFQPTSPIPPTTPFAPFSISPGIPAAPVTPFRPRPRPRPNQFSQNTPFQPFPTPYPLQQPNMQQPQPGFGSIMNHFKKDDGSYDYSKMMNTGGQIMGAVNQLNSAFKGFSSLINL